MAIDLKENQQFLHTLSFDEAMERWWEEIRFRGSDHQLSREVVSVYDAVGRVLAKPVKAKRSSPHYRAAALDGLAVVAAQTMEATPQDPLLYDLRRLHSDATPNATFVSSGTALLEPYDSVIPLSELTLNEEQHFLLNEPVKAFAHVRPIGDDVHAGEVLFAAGHCCRGVDLGILLAAGTGHVEVLNQPRIGILPVGDSLVSAAQTPALGQVVECISPVLRSYVKKLGGEARVFPIAEEKTVELEQAMERALSNCDCLVVIGGPSYGTKLPAKVVESLGECCVTGVAIDPGGSLCLGVAKERPVVVLPFDPVGALLTFRLTVRTWLLEMLKGHCSKWEIHQAAVMGLDLKSREGVEEFVRVKLGKIGHRTVAIADGSGATNLMAMIRTDGILRIPMGVTRIRQGAPVVINGWERLPNYDEHIIWLGTHDLSYDAVRSWLNHQQLGVRIHTSATGGNRGLEFLSKGYCHVCAIHIFDPESGLYNVPAVEKVMKNIPVLLLRLLRRSLGMVVPKGNPQNLQTIEDLARTDIRWGNRDEKSGTRQIIEHQMSEAGVSADALSDVLELPNHMAVAAAVAGGVIDAGPCISTVARAFGLDFVPLAQEPLDLVVPKHLLSLNSLRQLCSSLRRPEYRQWMSTQFVDYDFSESGELLWESP